MVGESGQEPQKPILSEGSKNISPETQKTFNLLVKEMKTSVPENGPFFVSVGRGNMEGLILKEGRKRIPKSDQVEHAVISRYGIRIVTMSGRGFAGNISPLAGVFVGNGVDDSRRGGTFTNPPETEAVNGADIFLRYGLEDKFVRMRELANGDDRNFVSESFLNSIRASKTRLGERKVRYAGEEAKNQKSKPPEASGEETMIKELSTIVKESAHPSPPFQF